MDAPSTTSTPGTALTVAQRASVALGAAEHEKKLIELAKQSTEIVAITNPASLQQCHGARMTLKNERINIERLGKAARDDATKFSKAVIAEENRLIAIIEPEEKRLQVIQDAHVAEVQRKADEAAQAEHERIERIQARIHDIRIGFLIDAAAAPSAVIEAKIIELVAIDISRETVQEFVAEAEAAREQTLAKLRDMKAAAVAQEAEAERLRAEREELDRLRAEQAERDREAKERAFGEEQRLEAQRKEAQARIEAQEREARERLDAEERRQQAERDRLATAARELEERQRQEREAVEAKARAEREAAEAREREERLAQETAAREQREAQELADRQERERVRAEMEAREAEERRIRDEAQARERQAKLDEIERLSVLEALANIRQLVADKAEFAWFAKAYDTAMNPQLARKRKAAAINAV